MHINTADTPPQKKIVVEEYGRMETGGWIALGLGVIGMTVLLCVGILTRVALPTGFASLTMGLFLSGCILLVGRLNLRKQDQVRVELDDHKADHQVAQIDTEDIADIKNNMRQVLTFMARRELEDRKVEQLVNTVEEFLKWKAGADERMRQTARQLAILTDDDVVDLDTVRELKQLSERQRNKEQ